MAARRIAWVDSCGQPSSIHLTADGAETLCGGHAGYIAGRRLAKVPKRCAGRSRFCRRCFALGGKSLPWDERCVDVEWTGPASAPVTIDTTRQRARRDREHIEKEIA